MKGVKRYVPRQTVDIVADDVILKQVRYYDGCEHASSCLICQMPDCVCYARDATKGNSLEGRQVLARLQAQKKRNDYLMT
jgi:hypothetical protein